MSFVGMLLAFALTVALVPVVRRLAVRAGLVAHPGGRHSHQRVTPTAGGLAMYAAFWIALLVLDWPWSTAIQGMFIGSVLLLALCLADDLFRLPVLPRLLGQILVAVIVWQYGVRIVGITGPLPHEGFGFLALGWLSAPITVLWIVFMVNAVNWLDGLDGLAAGVIAIAALTLGVMGYLAGYEHVWVPSALLAAVCLGFLLYNSHPASIFMGDTGAMFLGYMIACLAIIGAFKSTAQVAVAAPFLVLGIPIYDTLTTMARRLRKGRPVYTADRSHLHHRLLDRGWSVRRVVLFIYALTAVLCLVALGLWWL